MPNSKVTPSTAIKTYLALLLSVILQFHVIPSRAPSIHIFTTPKPFVGVDNATQLAVIASWHRLSPQPKITFLSPAGSPIPQFRNIDTRKVDASFLSVPLLPSILASLQTKADITILTNSDIHLFQDLLPVLSELHNRYDNFLAISARRDIRYLPDDPSSHLSYARRNGILHSYGGVDFWAWPTNHPPPQTPHFLFGRGRYDNWLTHEAIATGRPVVDITDAVTLAHVAHDHHLVAGLDDESNTEFWSRSGHFEAVVNGFLAERFGSYEPQLGTVLHAPLKMVKCFERGRVCVQKRSRPGICRCEHSPFVDNAMADSFAVNGSRTIICGLLSRNVDEPLRKRFRISGNKKSTFGLPLTKEQILKVIESRTGKRRVVVVVAVYEERELVMEIACSARMTSVFDEMMVVALEKTMYEFCVTRGLAVYLREHPGTKSQDGRDSARLAVAHDLAKDGVHVLSISVGVVIRESLWKYIGDEEMIIQAPSKGRIPHGVFFAGGHAAVEMLERAMELLRTGERLGVALARAGGSGVHLFDLDAFKSSEECDGCDAVGVYVGGYEQGTMDATQAVLELRRAGVSRYRDGRFCQYAVH